MVKRPGGSKACLTCVKRKKGVSNLVALIVHQNILTSIKCDQRRPACGQCRRLNLQCAGYNRPLVFKTVVPSSGSKQTHDNAAQSEDSILLHDGLSSSASYHQITGLYWKAYLPNGKSLSTEVDTVGAWIDSIQSLESHVSVIRKALLALSLATLGRVERREWMTKEGQRLYGDVLSDTLTLIPAQQDSQRCGNRTLELVTTVRLLSFFEVCSRERR